MPARGAAPCAQHSSMLQGRVSCRQVYTLRKLLKEKANLTFPADYSFAQAGGTQQRLDRLSAGCAIDINIE